MFQGSSTSQLRKYIILNRQWLNSQNTYKSMTTSNNLTETGCATQVITKP